MDTIVETSLHEPERCSSSVVTTTDFNPCFNDLAITPQGHDLLYTPLMKAQIECVWNGFSYQYYIVAGEENQPIENVPAEVQSIYSRWRSAQSDTFDYSLVLENDFSSHPKTTFSLKEVPKSEDEFLVCSSEDYH